VNFCLSPDVKKRSQKWVWGEGEEMAFFCETNFTGEWLLRNEADLDGRCRLSRRHC